MLCEAAFKASPSGWYFCESSFACCAEKVYVFFYICVKHCCGTKCNEQSGHTAEKILSFMLWLTRASWFFLLYIVFFVLSCKAFGVVCFALKNKMYDFSGQKTIRLSSGVPFHIYLRPLIQSKQIHLFVFSWILPLQSDSDFTGVISLFFLCVKYFDVMEDLFWRLKRDFNVLFLWTLKTEVIIQIIWWLNRWSWSQGFELITTRDDHTIDGNTGSSNCRISSSKQ